MYNIDNQYYCVLWKSGAKDGGWWGMLVLFSVSNLIFERSFCFK
jgi:hypothetical protein